MPQHVLLNNINHQHTRVMHHFSSEFGDSLPSVQAFPTEFIELQKEYPILVRRDQSTGHYHAIALLGLAPDENLFLNNQHPTGWDAHYIPATIEKGPFLIGFQRNMEHQENILSPVVHIDMAHPKVSEQQGQRLFLPQGGNSPYLEHISTRLQAIHQGVELAPAMFAAFEKLQLLEPLNIEFSLDNGEKHRLLGNYAINESRLAMLDATELEQLHRAGFLQLVYAMVSSITNIRHLIERKNRQQRQQDKL